MVGFRPLGGPCSSFLPLQFPTPTPLQSPPGLTPRLPLANRPAPFPGSHWSLSPSDLQPPFPILNPRNLPLQIAEIADNRSLRTGMSPERAKLQACLRGKARYTVNVDD